MPLSKNEIKFIKSLQQKKIRVSEGCYVVEGIKLVEELIEDQPENIRTLYRLENADLEIPESIKQVVITTKELERISGLKNPNQVLALVNIPDKKIVNVFEEGLVLLLDDVSDPGNLGTIIRTADWFGIETIICSPECVELYNPKVAQATMGAIFRVNVYYQELNDSIQNLKAQGYTVFAADMKGQDVFKTNLPKKSAVLMGSESHGVDPNFLPQCESITIPGKGKSESLNVAIAASIIMSRYAEIY